LSSFMGVFESLRCEESTDKSIKSEANVKIRIFVMLSKKRIEEKLFFSLTEYKRDDKDVFWRGQFL